MFFLQSKGGLKMPKREDINTVLVIGSGPIIIGQACEFDYSGTQACKALRGLGYKIVLVNSNPATIMTDPETADVTYIEPLNVERLTQIIEKERPDALLPNLGGQSALNLCSELSNAGVLDKYNVQVLGVKVDAIERGEDRLEFKKAMNELGIEYTEEIGEAAFYGPKLDFMVKDAIGRRWQLGTIQVDYNLPNRFKLEYTAEDNSKKTPVMIHRAPFGSLERFTAVLIEHTAGHFPLWLTPDQVAILPISEKYNDYAKSVARYFDSVGVRAIIDERNEKIGRKIRDNELKRVPYMVIVGEKESAEGLVSMRKQGGGEQATMTMEEFAQRINSEVADMLSTVKE